MAEENIGTEATSDSASVEKTDNKVYEIGFLVVPSVSEDKIGAEYSSLKDILEKHKAVVISEEAPRMRALTYEMRKETAGKYQKYTQAYFGWIKFEVIPEAVTKIEAGFKKQPSILRYLLVKTVRENTMTSPKVPSYRRTEVPKFEEKKDVPEGEKKVVSESELDKAIDAVIAE